jgi:hypothetical protein
MDKVTTRNLMRRLAEGQKPYARESQELIFGNYIHDYIRLFFKNLGRDCVLYLTTSV